MRRDPIHGCRLREDEGTVTCDTAHEYALLRGGIVGRELNTQRRAATPAQSPRAFREPGAWERGLELLRHADVVSYRFGDVDRFSGEYST